MTDLRKAAEMALEFVEWLCGDDHSVKPKNSALQTKEALRQALEQPVDAVNMSQERVDETAKGEHEPFIYVREDNEKPFGGFEHCSEADAGAFPVYTAPPKREWVGLTEYQRLKFADGMHIPLKAVEKIEAKLKEKNT